MAKDKLKRFAEIETFSNVIQPGLAYPALEHPLKGNWSKDFFKNNQDIVLELGCGRGEYTVYLAEKFPNKNFIGVDIKGSRLWRGAKTALEKNFTNAGFLRIQIENIPNFFAENEISAIWITFPDPQPQISRERKRLTSPFFMERYRQILKPGGEIHLKTDSRFLFDYTMQTIQEEKNILHQSVDDIYADDALPEELKVKTTYENIFAEEGNKMHYIRFALK